MEPSKSNDRGSVDESTYKFILQYEKMDIDSLGRFIAVNMVHFKLDGVFNAFNELFGVNSDHDKNTAKTVQYPKIYEGNSEFVRYISDVQRAICKGERICKEMSNIKQLAYAEQIVEICNFIIESPSLSKWRVNSLAVAVLIEKIGIERFCGCK